MEVRLIDNKPWVVQYRDEHDVVLQELSLELHTRRISADELERLEIVHDLKETF